jgi:hypothetical protein
VNVRANIVFFLLVAMLGGLVGLAANRERTPHEAPAVQRTAEADAGQAHAEGGADRGAAAGDSGPKDTKDAGPALGRPLRVVAMGWEFLTAGIVANGGRSPGDKSAFAAANLEVHLREADAMSEVESQLARGGADEGGADVAIVPLPSFAGAFERLRALEPEAFLVVGWSRGHEAILGAKDASLAKPRDPRPGEEVRLATGHGEAATGFALLMLDAAGIPPARVRLVNDAKGVQFAAVTRPVTLETTADAPNRLLITTADAPQAVPVVAVAPHGLIEAHGDLLKAWSKVWIDGSVRLRKDVPAAARLVAAEAGAPEASLLLERLGQAEPATVHTNARALGLSGRRAVTIPVLFQRYFRLWREVGAISIPAPDTAPVTASVFAALVRSDPSLTESPPIDLAHGGLAGAVPILASRMGDADPKKLDESTLVDGIGFLADIFDRASIRVSTRAPALSKSAIESAYGRFDIASGRLIAGGGAGQGGGVGAAGALIEVLAAN